MSELFIDFSEGAEFETIKQRLLSQGSKTLCHAVKMWRLLSAGRPYPTTAAGYAKQRHVYERGGDLNGFAGVIAASIVRYIDGKDLHLYRGAKVVALERLRHERGGSA